MKAVTAYPFCIEATGERIMIRHGTMSAMKCGIEAGNLRQLRATRKQRADRREIVGLVQRRQRNVTFESCQHLLIDEHRPVIVGAAMNDAMADSDQVEILGLAQPSTRRAYSAWQIRNRLLRVCLVDQRYLVGALGAQARADADAVHLAFDEARETADTEELEFEARGTGIDNKDRIHGTHVACSAAVRRRASARGRRPQGSPLLESPWHGQSSAR